MNTHVDTYKVEITSIGNVRVNVQGFELELAVNSIPRLLLEILPVTQKKQVTEVTTPSISDLTGLYDKLSEMAVRLSTTASVRITVMSSDKKEKKQVVTLNNWVLTSASLTSLTTRNAPKLTIVLSHPVVNLERVGFVYEVMHNAQPLALMATLAQGSNIISVLDNVYEYMAGDIYYGFKVLGSSGDKNTKSIVQNIRKELATTKPGKYLKSEAPLFLENHPMMQKYTDKLRGILAYMCMPRAWGDSCWSMLINTLCANTLSTIVPTYTEDKLSLEPLNPWQDLASSIHWSRVESVSVGSMDTDPIYGMAIDKGMKTDYVTSGAVREEGSNAGADKTCSHSFYFPQKVHQNIKEALGRIDYAGENPVVSMLETASYKKDKSTDGSTVPSITKISDTAVFSMNKTVAEALFNIRYRRNCKATVSLILTFNDMKGNKIFPGRVITIEDNDSRKLFYGYLTRMVINGSANGGGTTFLELTHVRPVNNKVLIDENTKNPCY